MRTFQVVVKLVLPVLLFLTLSVPITAKILPVGPGRTYTSLSNAARDAGPGDSIVIQPGTHSGGLYLTNIKGTPDNWITICAAPAGSVIYQGSGQAWHLIKPAYVHISGIVFQGQTSNGVNIDDSSSYATPAHHVVIESCIFRDINATGNNDLLKLSGLDTFEIRHCRLLNGSPGGSGIDMVGCHNGIFKENYFKDMGSNAIQAKGGTHRIRYERNLFDNGGARALNLGGSTGLQFFRPTDATYEARDLFVYANVFIGATAPIAYVGCTNVHVVNNTIYRPGKWVIRILQETVDTSRFVPCGNSYFRNNIVYIGSAVSTQVNIGANTAPETFTFSNNLWYHYQDSSWSGPNLPVTDTDNLVGSDPRFNAAAGGDFSLQPASPAIGKGYAATEPVRDYAGNTFNSPRSIGAFEGDPAAVFMSPAVKGIDPDLRFRVTESRIRCWSPGGSMISSFIMYDLKGSVLTEKYNCGSGLVIGFNGFPSGMYLIGVIVDHSVRVYKILR